MANIPSGLILTSVPVPELVELIVSELEARVSRKNTSEPLPDRISLSDVIHITGLKKSAIYKLTMAGSIPYGKYGRLLVFSRREITNWMDQQITRRPSIDERVNRHLKDTAKKSLNNGR